MENQNINFKILIFFLFCIICIGIVGFFYINDYKEFNLKKEQAEKEREGLKAKVEELRKTPAFDKSLDDRLKKINEQLENMKRSIPSDNRVPDILRALETTVNELNNTDSTNIEFKEIRISALQQQDTYSIQPLEIVVIGKFDDIGKFLSKLENLRRFNVNGGRVTLTPQKDVKDNSVKITMTLSMNAFMESKSNYNY